VARRARRIADESSLPPDQRVEQRRLADIDRPDQCDRDAAPDRGRVAEAIDQPRARALQPADLGVDRRGAVELEILVGEVDRAFELGEDSERALLDRRDLVTQAPAQVGLRQAPGALAARVNDVEQRLGADQVELPARHRTPRELARLGDTRSSVEHRGEQALEVVGPAVAMQLGDVFSGERRRRPHRKGEHLVERATGAVMHPRHAHAAIELARCHPERLGGDRDRARPTEPHDPHAADPGGRGDRSDRVVAHSAAAGTTRIWRSSPSPSLRLDNPGISAIAMCTIRRSCGVIGTSSTICLVSSAFSPIFWAIPRSRSICFSRKPPASTTSGLVRSPVRSRYTTLLTRCCSASITTPRRPITSSVSWVWISSTVLSTSSLMSMSAEIPMRSSTPSKNSLAFSARSSRSADGPVTAGSIRYLLRFLRRGRLRADAPAVPTASAAAPSASAPSFAWSSGTTSVAFASITRLGSTVRFGEPPPLALAFALAATASWFFLSCAAICTLFLSNLFM